MQQLIYFFQKYKYFLYFLLLQIIALSFTINNHSFHRSKFISSSNAITGGLYNKSAKIDEYFNLKHQNESLIKENLKLRNHLEQISFLNDSTTISIHIDSTEYHQQYKYINGKIIKNTYHTPYNFLLINRGKKHGIDIEMAVVNDKGIIGMTDNTSKNYARVQSILNKNSKINARFKNSYHFGSLNWDGKDYNIVQLTDIPRQAVYKIGDTIITDGKSAIFPEGIPIGTILNIPEKSTAVNTINIKLFNDMSNISNIYVIKNFQKTEIKELETSSND